VKYAALRSALRDTESNSTTIFTDRDVIIFAQPNYSITPRIKSIARNVIKKSRYRKMAIKELINNIDINTAKPILFSTEMVRKIKAGIKTQTRRVVSPRYSSDECGFNLCSDLDGSNQFLLKTNEDGGTEFKDGSQRYFFPPYKAGDILYVRETWGIGIQTTGGVIYRADYPFSEKIPFAEGGRWRPSIHMPKSIARIFLSITDVRIERLQDISESDAIAEGTHYPAWSVTPDGKRTKPTYRNGFINIWNDISKKAGTKWADNPFVFAYTFEIAEGIQ
jgi:hypothetical protein